MSRFDDVSRRQFLRWSGAAATHLGAGALLASCGGADSPATGARPQAAAAAGGGKTALLYDNIFAKHAADVEGHPESPARCQAIMGPLTDAGLVAQMERVPTRAVPMSAVLSCHDREYALGVKADIESGMSQLEWGDDVTYVSRDSWTAALTGAGAAMAAVDAVMRPDVANAFCVVRPPGHHAMPAEALGFCVFNNASIAARYAQRSHGLGKVLIVDWDAHHGNGTQAIFYDDDSVLYFSTHQYPWYPGTGAADETGKGKGLGYTINCPLPEGTSGAPLINCFSDKLLPAVERFKPELVVISAGFDARVGDPLAKLRLVDDDFAALTQLVMEIAAQHAESRIVSLLEGGYNLEGLGTATVAHVGALISAG